MLYNKKMLALSWTKSLGKGEKTIFSVRGAYKVLQLVASFVFLIKGIWVPCAPTRLSLPRKQPEVRFLPSTNYKGGGGSYLIGATCANVMKRQSTLSSYIALLLGPFGIFFPP